MKSTLGVSLIAMLVLSGCGSPEAGQDDDGCGLLAAMIGLGAMASSSSQYAGSAAGQGLGAGADAYGNCQ